MSSPTVREIVQNIKSAIALLESAERAYPDALQSDLNSFQAPETSRLEELLHCATHEMSSALALLVQDIDTLLARTRVRQEFAIFSPALFERVVEQGWSTGLVQEIHQQLPEIALPELSAQIKRLCAEWSALPNVRSKLGP